MSQNGFNGPSEAIRSIKTVLFRRTCLHTTGFVEQIACQRYMIIQVVGPIVVYILSHTVRRAGVGLDFPKIQELDPIQNHRQNMPKTCRFRYFSIICGVGYMILYTHETLP